MCEAVSLIALLAAMHRQRIKMQRMQRRARPTPARRNPRRTSPKTLPKKSCRPRRKSARQRQTPGSLTRQAELLPAAHIFFCWSIGNRYFSKSFSSITKTGKHHSRHESWSIGTCRRVLHPRSAQQRSRQETPLSSRQQSVRRLQRGLSQPRRWESLQRKQLRRYHPRQRQQLQFRELQKKVSTQDLHYFE